MTLDELCITANQRAREAGWWDEPAKSFIECLALVHSEISEALEELRDGHLADKIYYDPRDGDKPLGVPVELADAVIRIADLCGQYGIDLTQAVEVKMAYNLTRPYRHGGKRL